MAVKKQIIPWLFILPALILFIIFFIYPNLDVFYISAHKWDMISSMKYVGGENFSRLFFDTGWWKALGNTFIIGAQSIFVQLPIGFAIAYLLRGKTKGSRFFSTVVFIPMMIMLVALALVWRNMIYHPEAGVLNQIIGVFGAAPVWLVDYPLLSVIIVTNWIYIGLYAVIFGAALKGIPQAIFDSAKVDGLSGFQTATRVVMPYLKNTVMVALIMCISGSFKAFDLLWVLEGGAASPVHITSTYLVTQMSAGYYGYASAIAVACFILCAIIVMIQLKVMRIKV